MRAGSEQASRAAAQSIEFRQALVARLLVLREHGLVPTMLVREAARAAGVSERAVWGWLRDGAYQPRQRGGYRLTDEARELFFALRGNVAAVHRELASRDAGAPLRRTLQRAITRELSPGLRAYAADGAAGWRERAIYLRHEAPHRAAAYEADHKELAIEVLAPRAVRPRRPWATLFLDQYSRLIVGWALSLRPTAAEVLAALRMAVAADPERGFGGVPTVLRWDGGLEFAARAIVDAATALGCLAGRTDAYSPWQKGKIERLNRTLEQELISTLPRWTNGPRAADGTLLGPGPLTLERFVGVFADWVEHYNRERPHRALGGATPLARWRSDPTPVTTRAPEQLRWMLLAGERRRVLKDGIHFGGLVYFADALCGLVGESVEVRAMPHDRRTIEIYRDGAWLATGRPQATLTGADRERALEHRRAQAQAAAREARRRERRARVRLAPITGRGPLEETTVLSAGTEPRVRQSAEPTGELRLLGLRDVNRPRPTPPGS
jgi:putative transposase